jgi:hypothetical protein
MHTHIWKKYRLYGKQDSTYKASRFRGSVERYIGEIITIKNEECMQFHLKNRKQCTWMT